MNRSVNAAIIVAALAAAGWAWHATTEASRRDASLGAARQQIDRLNQSLAKTREELSHARVRLDAADHARQAEEAALVTPPLPPIEQLQAPPTSPVEIAQLQADEAGDPAGGLADTVTRLKDRH
ncbi:MAG TPA: hypothetical protein VMH77_01535 [Steroidobacteraceae bacterium]|nr:hypothetical protein [Steroidobacteraceae bacterium]